LKLAGKKALITGASQGFGLAVAQAIAVQGAHVMICARDGTRLSEAVQQVQAGAPAGVKVRGQAADVTDGPGMEALVARTIADLGGIDILVANAGVYGPKGPIESVDIAEWERAIHINLMGVVHSCRAVIPAFKGQKHGKIIILSGGGATKPMPMLSAYAASKAGAVRFAETLAGELEPFNIQVNSVAPGELNTRLLDEVLAAGPDKVGKEFYEASVRQQARGGTPLTLGADLCVFLASEESGTITGKLISAKWDPWRELRQHAEDLRGGDIYTLRRIVPGDRGKTWGG
jgi:3-oxoacyl-[acyl-carrier protein] reductase